MTRSTTGSLSALDQASARRPVATRAAGLEQLRAFLPHAGHDYAEGRNTDPGPARRTSVSGLSPYLRHRLVTEREVVAAVLAEHRREAASKFVQEVLWRTYWKGWLELRPAVWTRFLDTRQADRESAAIDGDLAKRLALAEAGETGIEGFDDWARELAATGTLHNHARMWFASIWIFTLRLPWTLGADFFLRHLLDADPASNTLSWRWVAGLQTAGKTYLATAENIARFTDGRFRPKGLAQEAVSLTEPPLPAPANLPAVPDRPSKEPALLLLTGEDLHPESLIATEIAGIVSPVHATGREPWPFGDKAAAFVGAALRDAGTRAASHFGTTAKDLYAILAEPLIESASAAGTRSIVTPYAPVGPVADALHRMEPALAEAGLTLTTVRRNWDSRFWPQATKGFFSFRETIPSLLAEDGVAV